MWTWIRNSLGRVFNLGAAQEIGLVALCVMSTFMLLRYRVPSPLPFVIFPWVGFALVTYSSVAFIVRLLGHVPTKDPLRREIRLLRRGHEVLLGIFIAYGLLVYANCEYDLSSPTEHKSIVLDISEGEFDTGEFVRYTAADLQSWRAPSSVEHIFIHWDEKNALWVGEPIVVSVRDGWLGIKWVSAIKVDEEVRMRKILKVSPAAAAAWKNLIWLYINNQKWDDAVKTTLEYFTHYPDDAKTFNSVADTLFMYRQFGAVIKVLDPVVAHRPDFDIYYMAAWTLGQGSDLEGKQRALKLAQTVVQMQPDNPLSHYLIGHVYYWMNKPREALNTLEQYLKMEPNDPEVEQIVERLHKQSSPQQPAVSKK